MEIISTEEISEITIPNKCRKCAVQNELKSEIKFLSNKLTGILNFGMEFVGESGQQFDNLIDLEVPKEYTEEFKKGYRQSISQNIEVIDKLIQQKTDKINANSRSCTGTLSMRGTKDNIEYLVRICTSSNVNLRKQSQRSIVNLELD